MKNFYCPDFMKFNFYTYIFNFKKDYPAVFFEDRKISTIYGSFPKMKWNGGRKPNIKEQELTSTQIDAVFNLYKYFDVKLAITATMTNFKPELLKDAYCNKIIEKTIEHEGTVLAADSKLEEYLRATYPNIKLHRSIIQTEFAPYSTKGYEISVLDVNKNNNWEFLKSIPVDERDKIEILANEFCPEDCPKRFDHYRYVTKCVQNDIPLCPFCNLEKGYFSYHTRNKSRNFIPSEKIDDYYKLGFNKFKLVGRYSPFATIYSIVEYLVKPEYQQDMLRHCFDWVLQNKM